MTGMGELVTWLRVQLDDDERVARQMMGEPGGFYIEAETADVNVMTVGAHVYRWTPKRVVAEVEAKRLRLRVIEGNLADDPEDQTAQYLLRCEALPYAGHDGYREEWCPGDW